MIQRQQERCNGEESSTLENIKRLWNVSRIRHEVHGVVRQMVQLVGHVLVGNLDASCLRYVLLMADFLDQVDWIEVEDFRAFASVVYPFLTVSGVNMVLNVHRNRTSLLGTGRKGEGGYGGRGRGRLLYPSLHCHHPNDSCIKMGRDKSHFNVSLIVRDKVARQSPETTICEEKGEPKWIWTEVSLFTSLTHYR